MCPCEEAPSKPRPPKGSVTILSVGGLSTAVLASVCCIVPLVFAALGVGVGATGFFAGRQKRTPRLWGLGAICQSRDGGPDQLTPEEEGTQRSRGDCVQYNLRLTPGL